MVKFFVQTAVRKACSFGTGRLRNSSGWVAKNCGDGCLCGSRAELVGGYEQDAASQLYLRKILRRWSHCFCGPMLDDP